MDLIEQRPYGLLVLIDEEVKLPKGGDLKWLQKCNTYHNKHTHWLNEAVRIAHIERTSFVIKHYAGEVTYTCEGFCDKNRDNLFRDLYDIMSDADHIHFKKLFPPKDRNPRKIETVGGRFRKQLNDLMTLCQTTQPRYIRCIKPNAIKKPNQFNSTLCLEQLTYAGIFEAVQIRKTGYPFRLNYMNFVCRYRCLLRRKDGWTKINNVHPTDYVNYSKAILSSTNQDFNKIAYGRTMVLYRSEEYRILELLRNLSLEYILPPMQRLARKYIGLKYRKAIVYTKKICQEAILIGYDANLLDIAIEKSYNSLSPFTLLFQYEVPEIVQARELRHRLKERIELTVIFRQLLTMDAYDNYNEFVSAVRRAEVIKDIPGTPEDMEHEAQVREMLRVAASSKIDPWASDSLFLLDKGQMKLVLEESDVFGYTTSVIEEIRRILELPEAKLVKLQLKRAQELGDPIRIINREIRLKDLFLDMHGQQFLLTSAHKFIRDPLEWASAKFFGLSFHKSELAKNMLVHSMSCIHLSLTKLDNQLNAEAILAFKNLMGWMGDRKYNCK